MANQTITALIADSHEIVRDGIASRLTCEGDVEISGFAIDGYSAIKQCRILSPDIVFMDIGLVNPCGMDALRRIRASNPDTKILVLSSEATATEAFLAVSNGATGYMAKQAKGEHFCNNLRAVFMGYACIPSDYLPEFVELRRSLSRTGNLFGLSPREVEVLEECCKGTKNKEIANKLRISIRTVETHRNSIYRKTSTNSADELLLVAKHYLPNACKPSVAH